ncbi:hypothetical protein GCM10020331_093200 [Ectobacillus funiculus]
MHLPELSSLEKHGEFRERALQDQLQRASALNIIINAISVWNTVYLEEAIEELKKKGRFQRRFNAPRVSVRLGACEFSRRIPF